MATGAFSLDAIGTGGLPDLDALRQVLSMISTHPGNVTLTQTADAFMFDITVAKTVDGDANLDLEALGGTLFVHGNIHLSCAHVALHIVVGGDSQGFYILPTAPDDHAITFNNIQVDGDAGRGRRLSASCRSPSTMPPWCSTRASRSPST